MKAKTKTLKLATKILPNELLAKIYCFSIAIHQLKFGELHQEIKSKDIYLIMSEHIYDGDIDYYHVTRIPDLV